MRTAATLFALLACLGASASAAPTTGTAGSRYQQERANCLSGETAESRSDCLREAGAARAEGARLGSGESEELYEHNARLRCQRLPDEYRRACLARMEGQGTTSGSVEGGGLLRELVTREVGTPPQTQPAPGRWGEWRQPRARHRRPVSTGPCGIPPRQSRGIRPSPVPAPPRPRVRSRASRGGQRFQ